MGRGRARRQAVEAAAGDRHHLPGGAAGLRPRLASGAAPAIHHQPRRRGRDHGERWRNPCDWRRRGLPGRGHERQGPPVESHRRQASPFHLRPHRIGKNMKLVYFNDWKLGVVRGDAVVDVSSVVRDVPHTGPHDLINGLIERFAGYRARLTDAAARGQGIPLAEVRIRPPLPKPTNIDCMAVNYMEDGTLSEPAPINAFLKSPNAVIGHDDTMVLPDVPALIFEGEAELALVIGKRASRVRAADAMSNVFGYVNFIDGSARGLPPP